MEEKTMVEIPDGAEEMIRTTSLLIPFRRKTATNRKPRSNPIPIRMKIVSRTGAGIRAFGEKWIPSDNITRGTVMYPVILKNSAAISGRTMWFRLTINAQTTASNGGEQTYFLA